MTEIEKRVLEEALKWARIRADDEPRAVYDLATAELAFWCAALEKERG